MKQLHTIQRNILYKLLFTPKLRYTEVKPNKRIENNKFNFHLDQLIKLGYIQKKENYYSLTNEGKEYTNRIDREDKVITHQAKLGTLVIPIKEHSDETEYLVYTRLKQPFYGCQGFMTGKIKYGETVKETAKRELFEETHLTGEPKVISIRHYRVYEKDTNKLVEDKYFFICLVINPTGTLKPNNEGTFEWVKEKDFPQKITNHFVSYEEFLKDVDLAKKHKEKFEFTEIDDVTEKF
jgi:ADP-ribose pyrophosphatase YjhB (NUDIX family)